MSSKRDGLLTAANNLLQDRVMSGKLGKVGIFGVPFDPADSPERLNLKLAYISQSSNGAPLGESVYDPYDVIQADLSQRFDLSDENIWLGKMPVDSWLTPRPKVSDLPMLTLHHFTSFLRGNGCWDYTLRVAEFVEEQVFPRKPVMIGVDHSLTGGVLLALAKEYSNLNVIILDAHFDVMRLNAAAISEGESENQNGGQDRPAFYECGNFLSYLLEKEIIHPENLWVLGVGEEILRKGEQQCNDHLSSNNIREVKRWIDKGVHALSKKDVTSEAISIDLNGPTYVSIDMDVGSLSSLFSARFMNCYGLSFEEFLHLLSGVAMSIREANVPLLGLDVMEIDIHFLEALEANEEMSFHDRTKSIVREIFNCFLLND